MPIRIVTRVSRFVNRFVVHRYIPGYFRDDFVVVCLFGNPDRKSCSNICVWSRCWLMNVSLFKGVNKSFGAFGVLVFWVFPERSAAQISGCSPERSSLHSDSICTISHPPRNSFSSLNAWDCLFKNKQTKREQGWQRRHLLANLQQGGNGVKRCAFI